MKKQETPEDAQKIGSPAKKKRVPKVKSELSSSQETSNVELPPPIPDQSQTSSSINTHQSPQTSSNTSEAPITSNSPIPSEISSNPNQVSINLKSANMANNQVQIPTPATDSKAALASPVSPTSQSQSASKLETRNSQPIIMQRRRNNPLQKPVGWNFAPADSLDPKIHSKHAKRQNIALEISSTEISYVASLRHMIDHVMVPSKDMLSAEAHQNIFGNLNEIYLLHKQLSDDLSHRVNNWNFSSTISDIFMRYIPKMDIYSGFINTYDKGVSILSELSNPSKKSTYNLQFTELLTEFANNKDSNGLDFPAYRIGPVQRLPRLCLLLEDLLRNTIERHPDYQGVKESLEILKKVSSNVNAAKGAALMEEHFDSIVKRLIGLSSGKLPNGKPFQAPGRHLVIEDCPMYLYGPKGTLKISLALFSDGLLIAKRLEDSISAHGPKLELLHWANIRSTRIIKMGTKQVLKLSKDWKQFYAGDAKLKGNINNDPHFNENLENFYWLEIKINENNPSSTETYFVGTDTLKYFNDWPIKYRATKANMRSKYWSIVNSNNNQNPPQCAYGTLTYYPGSNKIYYYGGISNKLLDCFYSFDLNLRIWSSIIPQGCSPPALAKHSSTLVGSKIYYFGGLIKNTVTVNPDIYVYDIPSNVLSGPLVTSGISPKGRCGHTVNLYNNKLYVVGGSTFDDNKKEVILDEMLEFDLEKQVWTALPKSPVARCGHVSAVIEGKLYSWGGRSPGKDPSLLEATNSSDSIGTTSGTTSSSSPSLQSQGGHYSSIVSVYDLAVRDWASQGLQLSGFVPSSRQWASGVVVQGKHLLVIGGKRDSNILNDIYLLDVQGQTWCKYALPSVLDPRMSHSCQVVENSTNGISVYIFGGLQLNEDSYDTTVYSNQFVNFQLHNKYIQLTQEEDKTSNSSSKINVYNASNPSLSSTQSSNSMNTMNARYSFVSKAPVSSAATSIEKTESSSSIFNLQEPLGTESKFGETWKAEHARTHIAIAAKIMKKPKESIQESKDKDTSPISPKATSSPQSTSSSSKTTPVSQSEWQKFLKKVESASKLKSPFLTTYMGILEHPNDTFWLMSEYCKHGSVRDYLVAGNKLREPQIQFLTLVMLNALQALHSQGLIHTNLKSSNLLLNESFEFKVCDFSLMPTLQAMLKTQTSWNSFEAPEVLLGASHSPKSDIFSLGVTIIEMAEFSPPYKALAKKRWSQNMEDFVQKCVTENDKLRPDLESLFNHPWIKTIKSPEKLQLELADLIKKGYAKDSKRRTASMVLNPNLNPNQTKSTNQTSINTSNSMSSTNSKSSPRNATNQDDSKTALYDEIEILKRKNNILRKKLRLLKNAYAELEQENAKLKESTTNNAAQGSSPRAEASEDTSNNDASNSTGSMKIRKTGSLEKLTEKKKRPKSVVVTAQINNQEELKE